MKTVIGEARDLINPLYNMMGAQGPGEKKVIRELDQNISCSTGCGAGCEDMKKSKTPTEENSAQKAIQ